MLALQIAFFGSSLVSAYWNGAATYYRGIVRAMHERGHDITFYEPDAWQRQKHRDMDDPSWAKVVVYQADRDSVLAAVSAARRADLIVKASGVGVFDELLEEAVLDLKRASNFVVFWDVDAPATLDRVLQNSADSFATLIPQYDAVFTYGGGKTVIRAYTDLGARMCVPIYNALDPSTHYPVLADRRFCGDLAFLGNRLPDREARVDEFFFKAAAELTECIFLLGGSGWADKPKPKNVTYYDHVYTADHNAFNSTPRLVLNVTRQSMARYGFSPATRVFEAAGASACLITDAWEGVEHFFEPGVEMLVASDGCQVAEYVRSVTLSKAKQIGERAFRRVRSEHTYAHRAAQIDALLGAVQFDTAGLMR
jgi:spore maturation protein CgeB